MSDSITIKVIAASAVSAYTFVKNSSGKVATASVKGGDAIGIVQQDLATDEVGDMVVSGRSLLAMAADLAPGATITSDASGKGIASTAATNYTLAQYIPSANDNGAALDSGTGLVEVLLYANKRYLIA